MSTEIVRWQPEEARQTAPSDMGHVGPGRLDGTLAALCEPCRAALAPQLVVNDGAAVPVPLGKPGEVAQLVVAV